MIGVSSQRGFAQESLGEPPTSKVVATGSRQREFTTKLFSDFQHDLKALNLPFDISLESFCRGQALLQYPQFPIVSVPLASTSVAHQAVSLPL